MTGTLFLLIIHQLEGSNKAEEDQAVFVLFLAASPQGKKIPLRYRLTLNLEEYRIYHLDCSKCPFNARCYMYNLKLNT